MLRAQRVQASAERRSVKSHCRTFRLACNASALNSGPIGAHKQRASNSVQRSVVPQLPGCGLRLPPLQQQQRRAQVACKALPDLTGVALFFAPGAAICLYALVKGKGNLKDGLSRLLTEVRGRRALQHAKARGLH